MAGFNTTPFISLGIRGNTVPPEGARALGPFTATFTGASKTVPFNLAAQQQAGALSFARSVFIDASQIPGEVTVSFPGLVDASSTAFETSQYNISVPGHTQGWYPVVQGQQITFSITSASTGTVVVYLSNEENTPVQWPSQ